MSNMLPDGTEPKSDKEYAEKWREFARPLKELLDAELYAFDWGITLRKDHKLIDVDHIIVEAVNKKLTQHKAVVDAARNVMAWHTPEGMIRARGMLYDALVTLEKEAAKDN